MNSLTIRRCSRALSVAFVACLAFAAHGATNVFDDAVFWFRGGKDISGDHCMQQGEFFDDLHADDENHANHKMSMVNYLADSNSKAFKENAALVSEQVVFPALGKAVEKKMNVLRLSNKNVRNPSNNKYYFWPEVVNPRSVFDNCIANEFTIISRMRLDDDGLARTQCVFKVGYKASEKRGMWLAFSELQNSTKTKYIIGRRTPTETGSDASFRFADLQIPTNTWFDLAVVVGNGKLRIGIALPETSSFLGNNSTIAFAETPMWTANPLSSGDDYRLFSYSGQSTYQEGSSSNPDLDKTCFIGSVQQIAIWGRALGDEEVMAAFGMPRPAVFRTGFDNGAASEFGGERSGSSQEIDGLGSWQDIANTMQVGDTWTVNFTALRDEAGLPQIFSIKSLSDSTEAQIEPILTNASCNTSLGERRVAANGRTFWPVPADLIAEGANTLIIKRKNGGAGLFKMDAMELGGSLGVGKANHTINDGRVYPERIATGVPSAADPNPSHWPVGFRPYLNNNTNLHFHVWVDPDVVGVSTSRFWTCVNRYASEGHAVEGSEEFTIYVNGANKISCKAEDSWENISIGFEKGELRGGWNDFEIRSAAYETCHWLFDRYRFETVLPRGFSIPPLGMRVILR